MEFEDLFFRNPVRKAFTYAEKKLLIRLIYKHSDILLNKGNGKEMSGVKKNCWRRIAEEYNSEGDVFWRSEGQLLKCWENMKTKFKRKLVKDDPATSSWTAERKLFETFECRAVDKSPSLSSSVKARAPPSHSPPVLVPIPPVTNNASSSSSPPLSAQQQQQQQQQLEHQSQDVCLRWNSYHSNMQQSFPMLLDTEQFVDVTLACEGEFIKCHKMVLSACSSFFGELLAANPCPHPVIVLRGSRMWEIRALVDFMYRGEVNVQQDRLAGLLAAAEEFRVKGLAGSCSTNSSNSANEREAPERAAKRQLKRKAAQPQQYHHQYNESSNPMRQMRPTTSQINSFPKMRIKPRSFASHLMEQLDQSENSVTHSDNSHSNRILKQKPRYNPTTDMEHDDNQPPDEMTNPNCLDGTIRVKEDPDQDESDHDKTPSNLMDSTLDDDHYSSSRYSSENTVPVDPLYMDEHRNELEDSIEEAYD